MPLWLRINRRGDVPVYLQLITQIRHALQVGILQPGDTLPTVRDLAKSLAISPNTISKAYGELEKLGLIESRAGAGTTVSAALGDSLHTQARADLQLRLSQLLRDAAALGVSAEELGGWFTADLQRVYLDLSATSIGEKEPPQDDHC